MQPATPTANGRRPRSHPQRRAGQGWIRRSLPFVRLRPRNLALTFGAVVAAGAAGAALLLVQRDVVDLAIGGRLEAMKVPLALLLGIGVVAYVAQRTAAYRELKAVNDTQFLVYDAVHRRMQQIDPDSQALPAGQLAARLNADIDRMSRSVASLPRLVGGALTTAATAALMLVLDPLLGTISLLAVPLLLLVARWTRRRVRPAVWAAQQCEAEVAQLATMAVAGVRVVKALGQEQREIDRMATASVGVYGARLRGLRVQATVQPLLDLIPILANVVVLMVGGWLILRHDLTLGTFLAFSVYNAQLVSAAGGLGGSVVDLQEAGVSADRVLDLLDLPPAVVDDPAAPPLPDLRGDVCLERVRFAYADGPPVLDDFSLHIPAGQTVALVGVAGSGKSTVLKLLARFHDPHSGTVRLDGVDLRTVALASVRRQVGVVFDEPMLLTGTVRDNIRYGRPDADDAAVVEAARSAGAHDFVVGLTDGYDTVVGERGFTLSGGQRQRIALARTLLIEPRLLLLDDPTAGVDARLEREIHQRLRDGRDGRTMVFIGYRASTVAAADRIVVMDAGRVLDVGHHDELVERCVLYRRLIDPEAARAAEPAAAPAPATGVTASAWRPVEPLAAALSGDAELRAAVARLAPIRDRLDIRSVAAPDDPFSVRRLLVPYWPAFVAVLGLLIAQTTVGVLGPLFTREAVDGGMLAGSWSGLVGAATASLALAMVGLLLSPVTMMVAGRLGQRVVVALRSIVWTRVVRLPMAYYDRQRVGRLLTRVLVDVEGFSQFASIGLVSSVVSALSVVGVLVTMVVVNPFLAGLVAATVVPFVVLVKLVNRRIAASFLGAREQVSEANAALQENLAGVREAQTFSQQERQHALYRQLIRRYLDHRLDAEKLIAFSYPVVAFLNGLALALVFGVGALMLAAGSLSAGELIAFVLWVSLFFPPIVQLGTFVTADLKRMELATLRIGQLMREDLGPPASGVPVRPGRIHGELRLCGVRFRYPGSGVDALRCIELVVPAGATVALVGATGAGKSTIFKLLARFYDPTDGQILVDGLDLRSLDVTAYRARLGYLPQEPYLFAGTVRDNIAYGRPDATDSEVEAAARTVGAHAGICGLTGGYLHVVGERGDALSAGLRQLVCLARTYLVDPAVVLLDEATAKLDLATEAGVLAAMRTVTRGRTTLMIAHRLQTVRAADRIAVVDDGLIVEQGTHDELLAAGGRYRELYEASRFDPAVA
jgi:ATP-binding cassette subfamily B protein